MPCCSTGQRCERRQASLDVDETLAISKHVCLDLVRAPDETSPRLRPGAVECAIAVKERVHVHDPSQSAAVAAEVEQVIWVNQVERLVLLTITANTSYLRREGAVWVESSSSMGLNVVALCVAALETCPRL